MVNPVSRIPPALLRKDNYFKTLPVGKLMEILALEMRNKHHKVSPSKVYALSLIIACIHTYMSGQTF